MTPLFKGLLKLQAIPSICLAFTCDMRVLCPSILTLYAHCNDSVSAETLLNYPLLSQSYCHPFIPLYPYIRIGKQFRVLSLGDNNTLWYSDNLRHAEVFPTAHRPFSVLPWYPYILQVYFFFNGYPLPPSIFPLFYFSCHSVPLRRDHVMEKP